MWNRCYLILMSLRCRKWNIPIVGTDRGVPRLLRVQNCKEGSIFFKDAYMRWGRRISSDVAPALKATMPETGDWNTSHVRISLANCLIYRPPLTAFVRMHCLSGAAGRLCNYYFFPILDDSRNCNCVMRADASYCKRKHHNRWKSYF